MLISPVCILELRAKYNHLPPKVRIAADYIIKHPEDVINHSLQELSAKIGVSQYTVLNCVRAVGFHGYSDFRMAIALGVQQFGPEKVPVPSSSNSEDDKIVQIFFETFETNARCILDTSHLIDSNLFTDIVHRIFSAKRTGLYGLGFSAYAAQYLCIQLVRLGMHAVAVTDASYQLMDAATLIENDLLFGFSSSGSAASIIEAFNVAKKHGCYTIAVTSSSDSDLAKVSDMTILTTSSGPPHLIEINNSIVEQISFASAISSAVYHELQRGKKRTI